MSEAGPTARRLEALFDAALDLEGEARQKMLDAACADDPSLRRDVEALLSRDARPGKTPSDIVASGLAEAAAFAPTMRDDEHLGSATPESPREHPAFVDRFEIKKKLGEGGMGVVYEAYDARLDRKVALKLVRLRGEGSRARLHREAQAMAKVAHPNVVAIHEVGAARDEVFVAMELVPGETLGAWQTREKRAFGETLAMYVAAGRGLAAAHDAGIVHRDFKPENVLVGEDGRPRVVDFGLARAATLGASIAPIDAAGPGSPPRALGLTAEGTILGTPAFMSPEHFHGKADEPAADQFSFAVALYGALFGVHPFDGATFDELREAVLEGKVRPMPAKSSVPEEVQHAVMRALATSARDRFQSMHELLDELVKPLAFDAAADRARGRAKRRAGAIAILGVGILSLAGVDRMPALAFTPEGIVVLAWIGLLTVVIVGFFVRRAILSSSYNRKVAVAFVTPVAGFVVHRTLAMHLGVPAASTMVGDAVSLAMVSAFASIAIERWMAIGVPVALGFAIGATIWPSIAVPGFGVLLLFEAAVCIWIWGEGPERGNRRAASASLSSQRSKSNGERSQPRG